MAHTRIVDDDRRNERAWPFGRYATLPTSALHEEGVVPSFHYSSVVIKGEVTQRCDWNEIPQLVERLRRSHWQIIDQYPQIGSFLRLTGNGKFRASVFHSMVLRVCERLEGKSKYEYWFLVNGKPVRFGAEEFSLVSGLRFGSLSDEDSEIITQESRLKRRHFGSWGKEEVSVHGLKTKITDLLGRNNPKYDETVCKLLFVWVVSALLVPLRPNKNVRDETFAICDDLARCERHPWGQKVWANTFDDLVQHMTSGPSNTRRWNAHGFPHIFLFWMLEVINGLPNAGNFTSRFDPDVPRYPRMLHWDMGGSGPSCSEMDTFFKNVQAVIPRLQPDDFELETAYYISARQLSMGVSSRSRVPVYCRLTEYLGDLFVVLRDEEGAPKFPNRPSAPTDSAPDAEAPDSAPDSAPVRRPKRLRRQDGASTSQAQSQPSQPSSSEGVPFWAHQMEQRIMTRLDSMQATLERLEAMALQDRARHGHVGNEQEGNEQEGNEQEGNDQGDNLGTHTHSTVYNAEDTCLNGDQEVDSDDDTMGWREPRTKKRHERMRTRSRHLRSPFTANDGKKKSTK